MLGNVLLIIFVGCLWIIETALIEMSLDFHTLCSNVDSIKFFELHGTRSPDFDRNLTVVCMLLWGKVGQIGNRLTSPDSLPHSLSLNKGASTTLQTV